MVIGVIDSGIGGLGLLDKLKEKHPLDDFIYLSDSTFFPYGEKNKFELIVRAIYLVDKLSALNAKKIYLACNTLSALVKKELEVVYPDIDFIGMIEIIERFIKNTENNCFYLLGSKALIDSGVYQSLFSKYRKKVIVKEGQNLINAIEMNLDCQNLVKEEMAFIPDEVECFILGCTHFIGIKNEFLKHYNKKIIAQDELLLNH